MAKGLPVNPMATKMRRTAGPLHVVRFIRECAVSDGCQPRSLMRTRLWLLDVSLYCRDGLGRVRPGAIKVSARSKNVDKYIFSLPEETS